MIANPIAPFAGPSKAGRRAYVRLFPERGHFLLAMLSEPEFVAYQRLLFDYVVRGGNLPADDDLLVQVTRLQGKKWRALKDRLLSLDLARIENGLWVDDDQLTSLRIQKNSSERGKRGAQARWGAADAA